MLIEFTDIRYREQFGFQRDFPPEVAKRYLDRRVARVVPGGKPSTGGRKAPGRPPVDKMIKAPPEKKDSSGVAPTDRWYRTRFTKVAWVADAPQPPRRPWGAEISNAQVIKIGRALGFEIVEVSQTNFVSPGVIDQADVVVLNNMFHFGEKQFTILMDRLFANNKPYVRYEHDYGFCAYRSARHCFGSLDGDRELCGTCEINTTPQGFRNVEVYRRIFSRAILNVFLSPLHYEVHERAFGEKLLEPYHLITPPVDVEMFKPVDGVKKRDDLVVCTAGRLHGEDDNKGWANIRQWMEDHGEYNYEIYTELSNGINRWKSDNHANVQICEPVPWESLVEVYSRAARCLVMPKWPEPAGRTYVEAALCGCIPVVNTNLGAATFPKDVLDVDDLDRLRGQVERGPYKFWRAVEEAL